MPQDKSRFIIATLIFILSAIIYVLFLVLLRYDLKPSAVLFWVPTLLMIAAIAYQIFKCPGTEGFILLEIFLFTLLAHWEAVIPIRFTAIGDDFSQYYYTTRAVMDYGIPLPESVVKTRPTYTDIPFTWMAPGLAMYPVQIMNGGIASMVTGADLIPIARWLPSIWSSTAILAVYLLSHSLYDNKRAALLAAFGFSTYITYIEFHSQYTRESVAFTMMMFALYTFYAAYRNNRRRLAILALIFATATVLAHFYVTIIWIALLLVLVGCLKLIEYLSNRVRFLPSLSANRTPVLGFVVFAVVIAFAHWVYLEHEVLGRLVNQIARPIIMFGSPTFPSPAAKEILKSKIVSYGSWFFVISFGLVTLWELIKGLRGKCSNFREDFALATWTAIGFIMLSLLLKEVGMNAGRVPVFVFPFVLIVVSHAAVNMPKKWAQQIVTGIVILSIAFNLFRILFIPVNPLQQASLLQVASTEVGTFIAQRQYAPPDPQGVEAAIFYQYTSKARYARWFTIGEEKVLAEPFGSRPYQRYYTIVDPDSYRLQNLVYDNGRVEIYMP